jgi:ABC-type uncharacterized transport system ATPase subunit
MTDDETERTGELFKSLAGKHSLAAMEQDGVRELLSV